MPERHDFGGFRRMPYRFVIAALIGTSTLHGALQQAALPGGYASPAQRRMLFNSIPKNGLCELLAFGLLYPSSLEGEDAFKEAWKEIFGSPCARTEHLEKLVKGAPDLLKMSGCLPKVDAGYSNDVIEVIEKASASLKNRKLKGYGARNISELVRLPPEEVDLARALLLAELEESPERDKLVRSYEASVDWMALQILSKLRQGASDEEKIQAINGYLFQTLHYRFPSQRKHSKEIDHFSLLGKVIEARQGVCLGVSLLFASLAQRIGLPYVFITPPGHILVRYEAAGKYRNIETTACGIHLEDEKYLGLELESLPRRSNLEAIGLAHINTGSTAWHHGDYAKALEEYSKAKRFMGNDPLLMSLTGFCSYLNGDLDKGKECLEIALESRSPLITQPKSIAEDLLAGNADPESIGIIYNDVDKTREALEEYRDCLEKTVARCPKFRAAWLQLGMTWLELQREDRALEALEQFHRLDSKDLTVEYLLAELCLSRDDNLKAWNYLLSAEQLCKARVKKPRTLAQLRTKLSAQCAYGGDE